MVSFPTTVGAVTVERRVTAASLRRKPLLTLFLLVVAASVLTLVAYLPLVEHPGSTVLLQPGDLSSSARDYWAYNVQGKSPFTLTTDLLFDAPVGQAEAPAVQLANALQPLFVEAIHGIAGYLVAFNVFMLAGVAASLVAMYFLLASLGHHPVAAGAGAVAFASSQWTVEQLLYGHVAFAQVWVFPLLLGSLLWARRGRRLRAVAPGFCLALSFYASSYLGLACSLLVFVFALALVWQRHSLRADVQRVALGVGAALVGLLPAALATRITPSSRLGLSPTSALYGAHLRDFVLPSSRHIIYGRFVNDLVGQHVGENVMFFGYGVMVLAAGTGVMMLRHRLALSLPLRFAVLAIPLAWFAALPAHERIFGLAVPLPDPAELIGSVVRWWRIYERIGVLAGFGLVLLASAALDRLIRSRRPAQVALAAMAIAVVLLEAAPGLPVPTYSLRIDAASRWLRNHPGGTVATYPMSPGRSGLAAWSNMYWFAYYSQVYHQHAIFDVPRAAPSAAIDSIASLFANNLAAPQTPALLAAEGVRYVVVHPGVYRANGEKPPRVERGLERVARFPGEQILKVTARPLDLASFITHENPQIARLFTGGNAATSFGRGFYGRERWQSYNDAHWLRQEGELHLSLGNITALPVNDIVYEIEMEAFAPKVTEKVNVYSGSQQVASFAVPQTGTTYFARVAFDSTSPTLTFTASPGPSVLGPTDPRKVSVYFESISVRPVALNVST